MEGEEGEQGEEGSEEVVRSKLAWDRKMEAAKLLDLESPVDTRRCVYMCVCMSVLLYIHVHVHAHVHISCATHMHEDNIFKHVGKCNYIL